MRDNIKKQQRTGYLWHSHGKNAFSAVSNYSPSPSLVDVVHLDLVQIALSRDRQYGVRDVLSIPNLPSGSRLALAINPAAHPSRSSRTLGNEPNRRRFCLRSDGFLIFIVLCSTYMLQPNCVDQSTGSSTRHNSLGL